MFLISNFGFFFLSGTLNFSYLELRILLIWSFGCSLSGALNCSYLELRILLICSIDIFYLKL